jgi:hypothetical protein
VCTEKPLLHFFPHPLRPPQWNSKHNFNPSTLLFPHLVEEVQLDERIFFAPLGCHHPVSGDFSLVSRVSLGHDDSEATFDTFTELEIDDSRFASIEQRKNSENSFFLLSTSSSQIPSLSLLIFLYFKNVLQPLMYVL